MIKRRFCAIQDGEINKADQQSFLVNLGWTRATVWDDLLQSQRILLISEAGAGKTYECRSQAKRLWDEGEPAFFVELTVLSEDGLLGALSIDEEERFKCWRSSQSDIATFFLDSIDELNLTRFSFRQAINKLKKEINDQLNRARIIITTRPVPFDKELVKELLPIPKKSSLKSNGEAFAETVMLAQHERRNQNADKNKVPEWRTVALMPLSDDQIVEFACNQRVDNPKALLDNLCRRNAQEFARRPQDLIELCADWREHNRIRTHYDQVMTNVRVKLHPRDGRHEPAELSTDKAIEGASRLALAMQMMRRTTIRHNSEADDIDGEAALNPKAILSDWGSDEIKALLERPLFSFASYGRIRFHHRSAAEFLAAARLLELRNKGMPFRALKRLIFAEVKGKTIVRPSKRPVAGWLARQEDRIYELLRDNEPDVLLNEGDPESLSPPRRRQVLRAYVQHYGSGGWRGLTVPSIQVHRFASSDLADEINQIWQDGVENPDVRIVLADIIEAGRINACADIVYKLACEISASFTERMTAIDALIALNDKRLNHIAAGVAEGTDHWPDQVAHDTILRLFPKYISAEQLCYILRRTDNTNEKSREFNLQLPRLVSTSALDLCILKTLRDGLVTLASKGLKWQEEWPHITSDRPYLCGILAATCERGLANSQSDKWLHASALALLLEHNEYHYNDPKESAKLLLQQLTNLNAENYERYFWITDALSQSLNKINDPWHRFDKLVYPVGPVQLNPDRDLEWIKGALSNNNRNTDDRLLLVEIAMRIAPNHEIRKKYGEELKPLAKENRTIIEKIIEWQEPRKYEKEHTRLEKVNIERKKRSEQKKAKARASWTAFWHEIYNHPDDAFAPERSEQTALQLWYAMRHDGDYSQSSGWNRRFIEEHFNKNTADRLRCTLMKFWRDNQPTFPSERPEEQRNTFQTLWRLGLAAIYAEAEDPDWADKLNEAEARLAAHYAPIEVSRLPFWTDALAKAHPEAVDQTLGSELSRELDQPPCMHSISLLQQSYIYMPESIAILFIPRLLLWLHKNGDRVNNTDIVYVMGQRLEYIVKIILQHGNEADTKRLLEITKKRLTNERIIELRHIWLSTLMRIDPSSGVEALESELKPIEPSARSAAVTCFAYLFDKQSGVDLLKNEYLTPQLLLRLLRLAYHHVRTKDDVQHEGVFSSDTRDNAEQARNYIATALLDTKGEEGWEAKLDMANDPLCAHFKDRIIALAEENRAQEIDAEIYNERQAIALDRSYEAPASTNEAMFTIMKDRLSELDELLLGDTSPRESWAGIQSERVMRREIARELRNKAKSIYTVDQEAVTADENKTDIRLRSTASDHEAIIELKLGDGRTAKNLRDTIENQLVKKYMAAENSRSGVLLITLAQDRTWQHPDESRMINADELLSLLRTEAERVQENLGSAILITVHFLDLRPRLPLEKRH